MVKMKGKQSNLVLLLLIVSVIALIFSIFMNLNPVWCGGIWDSSSAAESFGADIVELYSAWFWPIAITVFIIGRLVSDPRKKAVFNGIVIGLVCAYIISKVGGQYVIDSLDHVADWFSGGGSSSP